MGNSTHGRKLLPVPTSLEDGFRARGFRPVEPILPGTHRWTHPKHRGTTVTFVPSTIPGDTSVTASFDFLDGGPRRLDVDALLTLFDVMMGVRR
jgi:hypothetical protein